MADDNNPNEELPADGEPNQDSAEQQVSDATRGEKPKRPRIELGPPVFGKWKHFIVVIPFIVYLCFSALGSKIESMREAALIGNLGAHDENNLRRLPTLEEGLERQLAEDPDALFLLDMFKVVKSTFPYTYILTIGATTAFALAFCWGYFKIPFRLSYLGFVYGVVGVVVWIGLVKLDEATFNLGGLSPGRSAFNPFEELADNQTFLYQFLALRLFGMIIIVPLIEEFFIRGFLMRYVDDPDWDEVPIGVFPLGRLGVADDLRTRNASDRAAGRRRLVFDDHRALSQNK